ncbi:hypothetical protein BT63DRAFT_436614 [Microthyrium microscopicum]|uniref:Actin-like ATPase domain-containing protein n=1 Tax=Microthyrium microscopicum TaxID=703497 RepID=A0A6A6UKJ9_9PEZI|nr:hypothetical protein BT63DRAFT_436614 [Microthyrium microscopicum]
MSGMKADLVVGIDFGMTCTGVAYANLARGDIVRTVQKWPGRGQANENKVPTIIVYSRQDGQVTSWGFNSESRLEQNNADRMYVDWFKVYLDEGLLHSLQARDPQIAPASIDEVERWFRDYLSELYKHIEFKLSQEIPAPKVWSTALIEFIFSVPTTWQHNTVERFRSILVNAGFSNHPTHSIQVGLTEAEASAVATSVEAPGIFREGENLLVCDVGGGTTDLSVLKVESISYGPPSLRQLDVVEGRNIGSVKIDEAFEALVLDRLRAANQSIPMGIDLEDAAWLMMKSREYLNNKCDHGSRDDVPFFLVPVPDISPNYANDPYGISAAAMQLSQADMRGLFDVQIQRLFELIDRQLIRFEQNSPGQLITHLILSGGLGNSAYVQEKLRARYAYGMTNFAAARGIQLHVAPEPQLAVAKGVVHDRVRKVSSGQGVLNWRCARASYGTLCKIEYDQSNPNHRGAVTPTLDPLDGKMYVTQAIEWFIRKGEPVNSDTPVTRPFKRKLKPQDITRRSFPTSVLVSHAEAWQLPYNIHSQNVETMCDVISDLTKVPEDKFKLKNRHWWNRGKKYRRVNYDINVVVGAADLTFELWFDGQKISKDNPIQELWWRYTGNGKPISGCDDVEYDPAF